MTPEMLRLTSCVPAEACWVFSAISRVALPCSVTAVEIRSVIEFISPIVSAIVLIAETASPVTDCISVTWLAISSVAFAVWFARFLTSDATTAKPLPASPARARSGR